MVGNFGIPSVPTGQENRAWLWRTDGTGHELAMPFGSVVSSASVFRGPWALGYVSPPPASSGAPGLAHSVYMPARWNVATGAVGTMSGITLDSAPRISPSGWFIVSAPPKPTVVIAPDGRAFSLPATADGYALPNWISDDGRTMVGNVIGGTIAVPTTWSCTPGS